MQKDRQKLANGAISVWQEGDDTIIHHNAGMTLALTAEETQELKAWLQKEEPTLYKASLNVINALRYFYASHLGPDREIGAAMHELTLQVDMSQDRRDDTYEGMRQPLDRLIPLVWKLIATFPQEETAQLSEAIGYAKPFALYKRQD